MQLKTPTGRVMADQELLAHLRAERLGLRQRELALHKEQRAIGPELATVADRLHQVREAFGLTGLSAGGRPMSDTQLRRGGLVAYADDPHCAPVGMVCDNPAVEYGLPLPGLVRIWPMYGLSQDTDIVAADDLVPVSEWRVLPRPGRLTPHQRAAIAACPWCGTLGLVDGQDGEPEFCEHGLAADAAVWC